MPSCLENISDTHLNRLLYILSQSYKIDLVDMTPTFTRILLEDFMDDFSLKTFEELRDKIETSEFWQDKLLDHLMVPDTELLRDPSFWRYLRDVLLPAFKSNIRVFFPELNSGEELYSFLIALHESDVNYECDVDVYSTNEKKLNLIKNGFVFAKNFSLNSDNYNRFQGSKNVETYFDFSNGKAYLKPKFYLKTMFYLSSWQDIQPKEIYDLVIYRNKLLLFNDNFHAHAVNKIHTILKNKSFLAIGINETLDISAAKFKFTEHHFAEKIFKKRTFDGL
ncbi:MAG: hypothetical protein RIS47_2121 [Bacteroidota bacterium]|jgi:chemotaxis protein methyltransferase CheR